MHTDNSRQASAQRVRECGLQAGGLDFDDRSPAILYSVLHRQPDPPR